MRIRITSKAVLKTRVDMQHTCERKDGATDKINRGTDHVTRLKWTSLCLLLGVSVRGVSCLVLGDMRLVLLERRGKTGKAETRHAGGAGCKAVVSG